MTARALVCLTWTVLTFVFSFFLFLLECVAAPSVKRTLFSSALREHTNVACFSTTLFNPLPPPWTVQRADRWHFIFVFWIRFTTRESIRFLCSFSLTRAPTQKTGKTKMLRPKPKAQVKSRLKPIYFSDDCFLYMLFMLSAEINIGVGVHWFWSIFTSFYSAFAVSLALFSNLRTSSASFRSRVNLLGTRSCRTDFLTQRPSTFQRTAVCSCRPQRRRHKTGVGLRSATIYKMSWLLSLRKKKERRIISQISFTSGVSLCFFAFNVI